MTATVAGIHLGADVHASLPAGNAVPDGSLYSCTTHSLVYKSNFAGNSWATWASLGGAGGIGTADVAVLASDSAVSSTSFANSGLSFSLAASRDYLFEAFLNLNTNNTSVGIKLALNAADAGTGLWLAQFNPTTAPALNTQYAGGVTFTKDTQPLATTTGPGPTRSLATLFGRVVTTTNPDTLHLRHASETATLTTIYAGSIARLTRLA